MPAPDRLVPACPHERAVGAAAACRRAASRRRRGRARARRRWPSPPRRARRRRARASGRSRPARGTRRTARRRCAGERLPSRSSSPNAGARRSRPTGGSPRSVSTVRTSTVSVSPTSGGCISAIAVTTARTAGVSAGTKPSVARGAREGPPGGRTARRPTRRGAARGRRERAISSTSAADAFGVDADRRDEVQIAASGRGRARSDRRASRRDGSSGSGQVAVGLLGEQADRRRGSLARRSSSPASARAARARCEFAAFQASPSSATVRVSPSGTTIGS